MRHTPAMDHDAILNFWFKEIEPAARWKKDPKFDSMVRERFGAIHTAAAASELFSWRDSAPGRLAEIIVLDQFSRNMFRDTPAAFTTDPLALALAQEAVRSGVDQELSTSERSFLYMPYMHSESKVVHAEAIKLFDLEGLSLEFEKKHKVIIDRFGRYPHRNEILGRESTPEEVEFLKGPGSSF